MRQDKNFEYLDSEKYAEITDMCLASCLVTLGFPLVATNREPQKYPQVGFVFKNTAKLEETITCFFNGSLSVEPKIFWATVRDLKGRIRAGK